jgi:penicillin-binding protein 1A
MLRKFFKALAFLALAALVLGFAAYKIGFWYVGSRPDMPKVEGFYQSQKQMTRIVSCDDELICEVGNRRRISISIDEIPPFALDAFVAAEDSDFWEHNGYDLRGIVRSAYKYLFLHKKQGASTITQQVVKNLFFAKDGKFAARTKGQKVREIVLAVELEDYLAQKLGSKRAAKRAILEAYLNIIDFGYQRLGIEAASRSYFGHGAAALTRLEAVALAAIPKDPTVYNPRARPRKGHKANASTERRVYVLDRLEIAGKIGADEYAKLKDAKPALVPLRSEASAAAQEFCDKTKEKLASVHCADLNIRKSDRDKQVCDERVSGLGETVKTTVDLKLQMAVKRFAAAGANVIALRHHKTVAPHVVVIVLENATGEVRAMSGGNPYVTAGLNYAFSKRQPGSLFKIFDYGAAFERGLTPDSTFVDYPMYLKGPDKEWPRNYEPDHVGAVTIREAMAHSLNTVAMQVLINVGPQSVINFARKFGIKSDLKPDLSLALGSYELTPMEIAGAYSAIARGGEYLQPTIVREIGGKILPREENKAMGERNAGWLQGLLLAVVTEGTGRGVNGLLAEPIRGKTGTTSGHSDAWFAGFTAKYTIVVWVGNKLPTDSLGAKETGATSALPIWADVASFVHTGKPADRVKKMSAKAVDDTAAEKALDEGDEIVEDEIITEGATGGAEIIHDTVIDETALKDNETVVEEPARKAPAKKSAKADDEVIIPDDEVIIDETGRSPGSPKK